MIRKEGQSLPIDLTGKAVLVSVSRHRKADQQDDFFTLFLKQSGIDLTSVDIAATAFSNLLEDRPVHPLPFETHLFLVLAWGTLEGALCYRLRTRFAVPPLPALCVATLLLSVSTAALAPR
jgi:adenylate cyclase